MKIHIIDFLKIKKGVKSFTAKVFTVGNLKRVISFVLLLSMLVSSNAMSTLASTKPQKTNGSESVETENTTTPNEDDEFYAEGENSDELNGIDEDIEVEETETTENINGGDVEANENNVGANSNNVGAKHREPADDNENNDNEEVGAKYHEPADDNENNDNEAVGAKHREPADDNENNDNEEVGAKYHEPADDNENNDNEAVGAKHREPADDNENNDNEAVGAKYHEPDNDNENNDNEAVGAKYYEPDVNIDNNTETSPSTTSEANAENNDNETQIDENITNYIDLFIRNQKSGLSENNWKIEKVLMQATDEGQDIAMYGKDEDVIREILYTEEKMLSPIVSVVISDDYGLKKVVVVPAVWEKIYNEKEVIESVKNGEANVEIGFKLNKNELIKEVEAAISSGVDKYENYTGNEELSSIYMPEEIAVDVLGELYERSYEALKLEGIIKEEVIEDENVVGANENNVGANSNNVGANHWEPADDNENNGNEEVGANENNVGANHWKPADDNENNDNEEVGANNNEPDGTYEDIENEVEKFDITSYIQDEELLKKVVENYKTMMRKNILGSSEEVVEVASRSKKLGSKEENKEENDDFELPTTKKGIKYGANHSHSTNDYADSKINWSKQTNWFYGNEYIPISSFNKTLISLLWSQSSKYWKHYTYKLYIDSDNYDWNNFLAMVYPSMVKQIRINFIICLNGKSVKNFYFEGPEYTAIGIYNCRTTKSVLYGQDNKDCYFGVGNNYNYLAYLSIISKGSKDYNRGEIVFSSSNNNSVNYWCNIWHSNGSIVVNTFLWELSGLDFHQPVRIGLLNNNTMRPSHLNYETTGTRSDPIVYMSNCKFDYNDSFNIKLGSDPALLLRGLDYAYLENITFKNFNITNEYLSTVSYAMNKAVAEIYRVDYVYLSGKTVFENCSTGLFCHYGDNGTADGGFKFVNKGQLIFENCIQPKDNKTRYSNITIPLGLLDIRLESDNNGANIKNGEVVFEKVGGYSLKVTNCRLIGPAVNIDNQRLGRNFEPKNRLYFRIQGDAKVLIENNTCEYSREIRYHINNDTYADEASYTVGMRLNCVDTEVAGSLIVRNNTLLSVRDKFNDADSFKKYIETTDNRTVMRPTGVQMLQRKSEKGDNPFGRFIIGRNEEEKKNCAEPLIIFEPPNFPSDYLNAAGISSYRDYFAGVTLASRSAIGTSFYGAHHAKTNITEYKVFVIELNDSIYVSDNGTDDLNSSFIPFSIMYDNYDQLYHLVGNSSNNGYAGRIGQPIVINNNYTTQVSRQSINIFKNLMSKPEYQAGKQLTFNPDKYFPIREAGANYNNHNPKIQFVFQKDKKDFIYFAGDDSTASMDYYITYVLDVPNDMSWESTFGNGHETSIVQVATINSQVELYPSMWNIEDANVIGWTLTKGSERVEYDLKANLSRGLPGASRGGNIVLYTVLDNRNRHNHSLCGCPDGKCKHPSAIQADLLANGIDTNTTTRFIGVESATELIDGGSYYLKQLINDYKQIEVNNTLNLCLNGKSLEGITFTGTGRVNITNCSTTDNGVIISHEINVFGIDLRTNVIQAPISIDRSKSGAAGMGALQSRIIIKNPLVTYGKKAVVYGVDAMPMEVTTKTYSVLWYHNLHEGWTLCNMNITGYRSNGVEDSSLYLFEKVKLMGEINISGKSIRQPFMQISSKVNISNANINVKDSQVQQADLLSVIYTSNEYEEVTEGEDEIIIENSNITITNCEIEVTEDNQNDDISIVSFKRDDYVLDISNNVKLTITNNRITSNRFEDRIYSGIRFKDNQKIKAQNTTIKVYNNVGQTEKLDSLYQVYSDNSDGFIELTSDKSGKFSKDSVMTVAFSTRYGEGTIIKNWNKDTVEDISKYDSIFSNDTYHFDDLKVDKNDEEQIVRLVGRHFHKVCGEVDDCVGTCGFIGVEHTEQHMYKRISTAERILELPGVVAFELQANIGNENTETVISGAGIISICLSGFNMTNITFTGYDAIYITNCKLEAKKGTIKNVKYPENAVVGIGGTEEIEIKKTNEDILNINRNAYLKNVKITNDTDDSVSQIITKCSSLLFTGKVEISGFEITNRLIGNVEKLSILNGEVNISDNKFKADRSILDIGQDTVEFEVKNNSKLQLLNNTISKGTSVQSVIKVDVEKSLVVEASSIEIKGTKFVDCKDGDGKNKTEGMLLGIYVESDAFIELRNKGVLIVDGFETDKNEDDEYFTMAVYPVAVYSINTNGFVKFIGEVSDLSRMNVMFPGGGSINGRGIIAKTFEAGEEIATTIFTAEKQFREQCEMGYKDNKDVVIRLVGSGYFIRYNGGEAVGNDLDIIHEVTGGNQDHLLVAEKTGNGTIKYTNTVWFSVEGFTFRGWSPYLYGKDSAGNEDVVKAGGERLDFNLEEGEIQDVYAIWEQDTYNITYSASSVSINGNQVSPSGSEFTVTGYCGESIKIYNNIDSIDGKDEEHFKAKGLRLVGFKMGEEEKYQLGQEGVSFKAGKGDNIILTAVWEEKSYTINFNSGSYENAPLRSDRIYPNGTYGYYAEINVENPYDTSNLMQEFSGWKISYVETSNGENKTEEFAGVSFGVDTKTISKLVDLDNCFIMISATWKAATYEVVYKAGTPTDKYNNTYSVINTNADNVEPTAEAEIDKTIELLPFDKAPYTAEGFVITGWTMDEEVNDNSIIYRTPDTQALTNERDSIVILYAVWSEVEYTIRYYMDENSPAPINIENTSYYDNGDLMATVGSNYERDETVGRGWMYAKVEWDENGEHKEEIKDPKIVLRGSDAKKAKLTNKNSAVVSLYVNWVSRSEVHTHKICGIAAGSNCQHTGDTHSSAVIYETFTGVQSTRELMSTYDTTSVVLEGNITNNAMEEINVDGKVLNICLNGNKLENVKFTGSGTVNITNCSGIESSYSINAANDNMFSRCSVGVYGSGDNIVIKTGTASIGYVFNETAYTLIYGVKISGVRATGIGQFTSNSSNRWQNTTISNNTLKDFLVNDSSVTLKDCEIKENTISEGVMLSNIDIDIESGETSFVDNTSAKLLLDMRRFTISGATVNIIGNIGDNNNNTNENTGLLKIKGALNVSNEGKLIIEGNQSKKTTVEIDNASANNAALVLANNTLFRVNSNTINSVGDIENNAAVRYNTINNTEIRGGVEITNNVFNGGGVGLRVLRGKLRLGSTYVKVSGNVCDNGGYIVVGVLSDVNTGFMEMVDSASRFDVENSEMQVAFKNAQGAGYGGTIFIGFVDNAIKQVEGKTKNDWYNVVFSADTAYNQYTLLSVKLEESGTTGTSVKIVQVDPYKIIYKSGTARKEGGGQVVVNGNEFSQNVEGTVGIQLLQRNTTYTADAFTFMGWTTLEYGGYDDERLTYFKENTPVPDLDYARRKINGEDVVYLYAVWKEYQYKIEYNKAAQAAQGVMEPQVVYYYSPVQIKVSSFTRTSYEVNNWRVSGIKDSNGTSVAGTSVVNGIAIGNTITPRTVYRELLKVDGGVISLNASWIQVSTDGSHKHKDCGQYNNVACTHTGVESHSVNNTAYTAWSNEDTNDITSGSGYYYLTNSITRSNKVINVSGKLVICLNGKDLTGVRFAGDGGEVIITNCANYNATLYAPASYVLFSGVSGRVYGKVETGVSANRLVAGNSFKAINAIFEATTTDTQANAIITVNNSQPFGLSNVSFKNYMTSNSLFSVSGVRNGTDLSVSGLTVSGGKFRNLMSFDNSSMDVSIVDIKDVEASIILNVANESSISIVNDFEVKNSNISVGVINLSNLAISSTKKSRVNIHDNENMQYVVKIDYGSNWYSDADSELNLIRNTLASTTAEQGILILNGILQVAGELNVNSNKILSGNNVKAGILVGVNGCMQVKSASIVVKDNEGTDIFQVYSKNLDGFMEGLSGFKFRASSSKMKIAFPEPYTGVVFKYWNSERVEDIDSVSVKDLFEPERGIEERNNLDTFVTKKNDVPCVVISKPLSDMKFNVIYKAGTADDSKGNTYNINSNDIVYSGMSGQSLKLEAATLFSYNGFRISKWIYDKDNTAYDPGKEISVEDLQINGDGDSVVFTAVWTEISYNIQYTVSQHDDGAKLDDNYINNKISVKYYTQTRLLGNIATREPNYVLSGWQIVSVLNKNNESISHNNIGTSYGATASVSQLIDIEDGTVVLSALWQQKGVQFTFTINGSIASDGNSKTPSQTSLPSQGTGMGNNITFTANGVTMKGFTLVGYTDGTHTFELNKDYRVTTDNFIINKNNNNYTVNLVSVWKENEYTLKLTKNNADPLISGVIENGQEIKVNGQSVNYKEIKLKYYEAYQIKQDIFKKPGYRINRWKVNKINNVGDTAIDTALANGQITARYYVMPDDTNSITDLPVSQLLDIKDGSIELIAELENTHKHFTNGKSQDTSGEVGKFAYEPLTQGGVSALKTAFYDSQNVKMGFFFLTEDIILTDDIPVNGYAGICLNGYDLDMDGHSFINSGMMHIYICSCRRTEKPGNDGQVIVYDGAEYTDRKPAFNDYTSIYINAYTLDGQLGYVNINVTPFGTGLHASTGPNVQTTRENNLSNRRGNTMGGSRSEAEINSRGEPLGARMQGSSDNRSGEAETNSSGETQINSSVEAQINRRGEPLGARVQDSSNNHRDETKTNRRGEVPRALLQESRDSHRGEVPRAQLQDSSDFKSNLETTKNILNMLYAVSVNNILTDSKVYDSGNFIDANGKLQYIIDDNKLRNGIYKIKVGNKINIYSFDKDGNIETGIKVINGESYFFKETGEMAINEKVRYGNVEYEVNDLGIIKNRTILQLNNLM